MKVLLLANNWVGWKVVEWLRSQQVNLVGLVLHPAERQKYGPEIKEASGLSDDKIFDGSRLEETEILKAITALNADIAVSVLFGYILRPDFLNSFSAGCVNLHPAYLPFNRGAHPNVWSIVEGTPAGVTIHYVDKGVDTGDIIAQAEVPVLPEDTAKTLYERLEKKAVELFQSEWSGIVKGECSRQAQGLDQGSVHRVADLKEIEEIDLDAQYSARELINRIRAQTFSPYPGAYYMEGQQKIYLRLELSQDARPKQGENNE